jgi:hypothetical protein
MVGLALLTKQLGRKEVAAAIKEHPQVPPRRQGLLLHVLTSYVEVLWHDELAAAML